MVYARHKVFHGVSVGILMVNSQFRRLPGDVGNATSFSFPVQYKVVEASTPAKMMDLDGNGLLAPFIEGACELAAQGVDGIATTCGFLALYQDALAQACGIPVASSSLLQVPWVERLLPPGQQVGVLTFEAKSLTPAHLEAAGVRADIPVQGMPADSLFVRSIKEGHPDADPAVLRDELLDAASQLLTQAPNIGAIVLECTNMPPFSADIVNQFGLPVFDAVSLINWFHMGLRPRQY